MVFKSSNNDGPPSMVMLFDLRHHGGKQESLEDPQQQQSSKSLSALPKGSTIIALTDPFSGDERHYLRVPKHKEGCDLMEIQTVQGKSPYGSYFVGSRVISDGALYVSTRVDPLYHVLHTLEQQQVQVQQQTGSNTKAKWQPLDQLLADIPKPIKDALQEEQLKHLCDVNDSFGDDMVLFRYSPDLTLKWLKQKQNRAFEAIKQEILEAKKQNMEKKKKTGGAYCSSFNPATEEEDKVATPSSTNSSTSNNNASVVLTKQEEQVALEASLQVVCEYLSPSWRTKLVQSFDLTTETVLEVQEDSKKRKAVWEDSDYALAGASDAAELLQFTMGGGANSTTATQKENPKVPPQSAGLKRLQKVSTKGMKSLTSFFGAAKPKTAKKQKKVRRRRTVVHGRERAIVSEAL